MKNYFLILLLSCIVTFSFGQIEQGKAIDSLFSDWDSPENPGASIGIIRDGELIFAKGYGSADLEHDIPISPASVFYIGSVSKQFVTFCILLLEEKGKLDLDDRIQQYLPDFPEYDAPITIRHFIHHTSGVRDYLTLMYLKGRDYLDHSTQQEVYELIKRQEELNFVPGERYLYSNSCYFMLAMIVEKASGQSLRQFARENIFNPLGMKHTLFYDDNRDLIKNRVHSYNRKGDGFENLIMRFDLVGSGGVYSTVEDLYLWDQNFYHNTLGKGGPGIIEKMQTEGTLNNGESAGYAFALNIGDYKGLKTVSHGGALAGYRAQLLRFPEQRFSVVVLANRGDANPTQLCYRVADILLADRLSANSGQESRDGLSEKDVGSPPDFTQEQIKGAYELQPGVLLEVDMRNDSLVVTQTWNNESYTISNYSGNRYRIPDESNVDFVFSELREGSVQLLTIFQNESESVWKRKKRPSENTIHHEVYTGNYYSKEIDANYFIYAEDGALFLRIEESEARELSLYDTDQFLSEDLLLRFERQNGKVLGFELDAGRVQNLLFTQQ